MDIKGLDYNTQRSKLILSEYGREIQKMVEYACELPTKEERLKCHRELDIDWPYDVSEADKILSKPDPLPLPDGHIKLRHYGHLVEELLNLLKTMPEGEERDALVKKTANQMKRDLVLWGHGSIEDERVADDLARYTDGKIQLDLNTFKFEKINPNEGKQSGKKKK